MNKILLVLTIYFLPILMHAQKYSISGVVKDKQEILPGIAVQIKDIGFNTVTDFNGQFQFVDVPAGTYEIVINTMGYNVFSVMIEVPLNKDIEEIQLIPKILNEVEIVANIKGTETKALNMMKAANVFANIVSAEDIGKLPDRNVAEAVQRLPGVVMETDQGEGRFVSFRGTPSDWSSALVNGNRMPVADESSKTRAMNFDIFPSSMVDYISVSKTLLPDMEADAIGGSANFITKNAPDVQTFDASIGAGYNAQAQKPVYNGLLAYGNRSKNKKIGYYLGGSWYSRNWATDNYQVYYGSNLDHSLTRLELRDYEGQRNTLGVNTTLEYKINNNAKIYLKGVYGSMTDEEINRKTMYNYSTGWGQSIKLQNIYNIMNTRFMGIELGGDFKWIPRLKAEWALSSNSNRFTYGNVPFGKGDERNGYHVVEFEKMVHYTDFLYLDANGNATDERNAHTRMKVLNIDSPIPGYGDNYKNIQPTYRNVFAINSSDTMFIFSRAYSETNMTKETDPLIARVDFNYAGDPKLQLKFGAKIRYKTGERSVGLELWERNKNFLAPILYNNYNPQLINERGGFLEELGTPYQNKLYTFLTKDGVNNFVKQLGDTLTHIPFGVQTPYFREAIGSSYAYKERVYAGYAMLIWTPNAKLTIIPGVRAEYTMAEVNADSVEVIDPSVGTVELTRVSAVNNYLSLLPMLSVKYAASNKDNFRLAITRSFRRPNFNEMKPGAATMDYSNFDIVYGNSLLKPTYSWNFDLAYEYYIGAIGMFSLAPFYKHVTDHIYTAFESSDMDANGVANEFQVPGGVVAKKYQNASSSYAIGIELSFKRKLTFLPGYLRDIGVGINYSYTHSAMKIAAREKPQQLPRQSPNVCNVYLAYDNYRINARIGVNYRDPYLYELNLYAVKDPGDNTKTIILHQDNDFDMYVGKNLSLDCSFSYRFLQKFSGFLELNNLTNTPYHLYRGRQDRPVKTEYYSVRGLVGLRYSL